MAGFSIMLMNFILFPLIFVFMLVAVAGLFCLGGLAAAGAIFLFGRIGRQHDRTLYIRIGNTDRVTALLRGANVRRLYVMRSGAGALVKAQVGRRIDLESLMRQIAANCAGIQGMYVK